MAKPAMIEGKENHSYFWPIASLIIILLIISYTRGMPRPFGGLHSWADASGAWAARSHINYGLSYTKGMTTWAVGNPPAQNPQRYMDHPQIAVLFLSMFMKIFGVSEFSYQLQTVLMSIGTLIIILKLFKGLMDNKTALLAAMIYTLFPIISYFGTGGFPDLFGFLAIYAYLGITDRIEIHKSKRYYMVILGVSLFMSLQFGWTGFFFGMAIGFDYLFQCLLKKKMPNIKILAVIAGGPLSSLFLDFLVMAINYGGINKIIELYRWRSAKGEVAVFEWGAWFAKMWEFASTNFSVPVLIAAILYLTIGQLIVFSQPKTAEAGFRARRFPCLFLFFLLPFFQLFILKGALWRHQTWEMPLCPLVAIAAAQGAMLLGDLFSKINKKYAVAAVVAVTSIFLVYLIIGTNYYYAVRWQPEAKIDMFKMLNSRIPPDKHLLSFDPFVVDQHESKGAFYRPEIAWYLDREIIQAAKLEEITAAAKTGKYPFYLMPLSVGDPQTDAYLSNLSKQLGQFYKYEYIPGVSGETDSKGRFLKAGMSNYILFDLEKPLK
jgi:hypothetical protein